MAKPTPKKKTKRASSSNRMWPVFLVLGGALLIALAYFALRDKDQQPAGFQPQVSGAPAIAVQPESINMGDVKLGTSVQAAFTVTNVGDETLHFSETPYIELVEGC